jgi:hypothetical protein
MSRAWRDDEDQVIAIHLPMSYDALDTAYVAETITEIWSP